MCFPPGIYYIPGTIAIASNNTTICAYGARLNAGALLSPGNTWCDLNGINYFHWMGGRIVAGARVSLFKCDTTLSPMLAMTHLMFNDIIFDNLFYCINLDGSSAAKIRNVICSNLIITSATAQSAGALLFRDCEYVDVDNILITGGNGTAAIGFAQDCTYCNVNNITVNDMDDTSSVVAAVQFERCLNANGTITNLSSDHDVLISDSGFVTTTSCVFRCARVITSIPELAVMDNIIFSNNVLARIESSTLGTPNVGSRHSAYFYNNTIYSTGVLYGGVPISISIFLTGARINNLTLIGNTITGDSTTTSLSFTRSLATNRYYMADNNLGGNPISTSGSSGILETWNNSISIPTPASLGNYIYARFDAATTARNSSTFANILWETIAVNINNEYPASVFVPWKSGMYNFSGTMLIQSAAPPVAGDRWELRLQRIDVPATIATFFKHTAASTTSFSEGISFGIKSAFLLSTGTYQIQYRNVDAAETGAGQNVNVLIGSYVSITPFRG